MPNPHRRRLTKVFQHVSKSMDQHLQRHRGPRVANMDLKQTKADGDVVDALWMILCDFATCCYKLVYAASLFPMQERHMSKLHLQSSFDQQRGRCPASLSFRVLTRKWKIIVKQTPHNQHHHHNSLFITTHTHTHRLNVVF